MVALLHLAASSLPRDIAGEKQKRQCHYESALPEVNPGPDGFMRQWKSPLPAAGGQRAVGTEAVAFYTKRQLRIHARKRTTAQTLELKHCKSSATHEARGALKIILQNATDLANPPLFAAFFSSNSDQPVIRSSQSRIAHPSGHKILRPANPQHW
jgi:hypothetical protein